MDIKERVGRRLRAYRVKKKLSQEQLGALLGISGPAVCYIEKGDNVTLERTVQIAALLGVTVDKLVKGEPEHAA